MADQKKKNPRFTTPAGTAQYPRLTRPDTRFDPNGTYSTKLVMSLTDAEKLKTQIDELMEQSLTKAQEIENTKAREAKKAKAKEAKQADPPYVIDEDAGTITFSFKRTASGISKKTNEPWTAKVPLFDRFGAVLTDPNIGGGSTIKVTYEPSLFYIPAVGAGVKLNLVAAQILKLVEWTGGDASSYGFESEEAEDAPETETPAANADEKDF